MSTLKVPSAQLFYEVSGDGPLLLLMEGGQGRRRGLPPGRTRTDRTVPGRDRTFAVGFPAARSTGPRTTPIGSQPKPMMCGARPSHRTSQPATVIGLSSGAIVALEVLARSPERVKTVVAHEPPVNSGLSDAAHRQATGSSIYDIYRKEGVRKAMLQFGSQMAKEDRQMIERAMTEQANAYTEANTVYFMEHELGKYLRVALDLARLSAHASQLVLIGGRDAQDKGAYQAASVLVRRLGLALIDVLGGHLGFMTAPTAFAQALMELLKD